jgi:DNA-binding transcriptional MerR regulator
MSQIDRDLTTRRAAALSSGELCRVAGVTRGVLRTYEALGLIEAARTPAGYRLFAPSTVERLAVIQAAKAVGLTLIEARELLPLLEPGRFGRPRLLAAVRKHYAALGERIEHLVAIREVLASVLADPDKLIDPDCNLMAELALRTGAATTRVRAIHSHDKSSRKTKDRR